MNAGCFDRFGPNIASVNGQLIFTRTDRKALEQISHSTSDHNYAKKTMVDKLNSELKFVITFKVFLQTITRTYYTLFYGMQRGM